MSGQVFVASYASRHFDFEGVGTTEAAAREALARALAEHARQCDLPADWAEGASDAEVRELVPGRGYRDGAPLGEAGPG